MIATQGRVAGVVRTGIAVVAKGVVDNEDTPVFRVARVQCARVVVVADLGARPGADPVVTYVVFRTDVFVVAFLAIVCRLFDALTGVGFADVFETLFVYGGALHNSIRVHDAEFVHADERTFAQVVTPLIDAIVVTEAGAVIRLADAFTPGAHVGICARIAVVARFGVVVEDTTDRVIARVGRTWIVVLADNGFPDALAVLTETVILALASHLAGRAVGQQGEHADTYGLLAEVTAALPGRRRLQQRGAVIVVAACHRGNIRAYDRFGRYRSIVIDVRRNATVPPDVQRRDLWIRCGVQKVAGRPPASTGDEERYQGQC